MLLYFQIIQSIGNESLSCIDEKFIVAGDFLKKLIGDTRKLDCLTAFSVSLKIVEWILQETTGTKNSHLCLCFISTLCPCMHAYSHLA